MQYDQFLDSKAQEGAEHGFEPSWMPDFLYDFQKDIVRWSVRRGRSAIFADCGLGKTPMQLVWAANIVIETKRPVLIITPLAVANQTIAEAEKFDIEARRSSEGFAYPNITVTNYERLHYFDPLDFAGVVCDESSILKNFDGARKAMITEFMRLIPYRLLCTATAAPNDYMELGTSSEALGYLGYMDMLTRFFTNKEQSIANRRNSRHSPKDEWRFKPHAEQSFWRWVCSWARAIRKPSDLGYPDDGFVLPELYEQTSLVEANRPPNGMLFDVEAIGLREEREVRRRTITERCEVAASKVTDTGAPAVLWCHLNDEGDRLEKLIPDAQQISGKDSDDSKERKFEAFKSGATRVLILKPKIGAFGLNWQHCAHVVYFPSHSYEQYYQAVRRCWRFGQQWPVRVDLVRAASEERMMANLHRKSEAADQMFTDLVTHMNDSMSIERSRDYPLEAKAPSWL